MTFNCRTGTTHCCGVAEFQGMNDLSYSPENAVACINRALVGPYGNNKRKAVLYASQVFMIERLSPQKARSVLDGKSDPALYGLSDYIEEHGLGFLSIGELAKNPNSANRLVPAWFTVEKDPFVAWAKKNYYKTSFGKLNPHSLISRPKELGPAPRRW